MITRLERLEYGQNDLLRQLGILTAALGDSPKELIIAAEKVKDNFAAFDQLRDDVFQTKLIAQDFASQMGELQDTLEGLNQAMYDKEGGLTTKISAMDGQMSEMLRDLQAIKGKLGIGTP